MEKASASGAEDCRFESCLGRHRNVVVISLCRLHTCATSAAAKHASFIYTLSQIYFPHPVEAFILFERRVCGNDVAALDNHTRIICHLVR